MSLREPVSVVIPAYNEEKGVAGVVREVRKHLKSSRVPHEILVVDDGSRDATAEEARKAGALLVCMGENRGYGASLKAGIRQARYELIAILDADGTYPAEDLPALLESVQTADMAVGRGSNPTPPFPHCAASLSGCWENGPTTWRSVRSPT